MILTQKIRILASKRDHELMAQAVRHTCDLYNAALEERIDCYRKTGKTLSLYDQQKKLTELRNDASFARYSVAMQRWPLKCLDAAFKNFFNRARSNATPGFPRFRSYNGKQCFGLYGVHGKGWCVSESNLVVKGLGRLRLKPHRIIGKPKSLVIKRYGKKWFALVGVEVELEAMPTRPSIGIDVGLSSFATLSDGTSIQNPRIRRSRQAKIAEAQQALARGKKGSKRRARVREKLRRLREAEANARSTFLHQMSAKLTRAYGTIVVEDLKIQNMSRSAKGSVEKPGKNVAQKAGLNASIQDAGWAKFITYLAYKAERAGGRVVKVDPRNTSQMCSGCGKIVKKALSERTHECPSCGIVLDRDHNAAINILHRGVSVPVVARAA